MSYDDYKLGIEACRKQHDTHRRRRRGWEYAGLALGVLATITALAGFITAWTLAVQTDGAVAPALWIGLVALALIPVAAYMIGASE
ncbi:hypothetical protein [Corynebacterium sp.]|uniref:hypothetical protein n=1 Tax=Corynebacterium sp. TaxID=1720 RepID=UPI0028AF8DCB|nr:hypothetical protein [Corynebacterium sp.]